MYVWHLTADAPRTPLRVTPEDWVAIDVGTWPIEPGQSVWLEVAIASASRGRSTMRVEARWRHNGETNSYWRAELPPFAKGDVVRYQVCALSPAGGVRGPVDEFRVGPRLHLALLWHQHQPLYRDVAAPSARGSYLQSAVRRHALRDYYAMAALVAAYPGVHLTINLTPALLSQIEDYVEHGATDRALELTLTRAEGLTAAEREEILRTFFDAHEAHQIRPHARYAELLAQARAGRALDAEDVRDLQMWFNLAWFAKEFREGDVRLVTGEVASVQRFVARGRGFTAADIEAMVAEQYKILRAVLPIHRELQERGQIEVATSPYFHPILPLLVDSDAATLDRPGATLPPRFAHTDDAEAQVRLAVEDHERWFGRAPRGMWPAEGAVSGDIVPILARHGVRWLASDRGVLARSDGGRIPAHDPDAFCTPYLLRGGDRPVAAFFRDAWLSDHIGFHYQHYADYAEAAREFLRQMSQRFARQLASREDRVLTVVLDGENAWSAYREDARPFLHALYRLLERDREIETVTFSEWLDGNAARGVRPHRPESLPEIRALATGSWADEAGSAQGVDLGTWIGEPDENEAWTLLGEVRGHLEASGATPGDSPDAYRAMYAAEGSDWFWWLGTDQESGRDAELDDIFHSHLRGVYLALGEHPPPHVVPHVAPPTVVWTPTCRPASMRSDERLLVRTQGPGSVTWRIDGASPVTAELIPVREPMLAVRHHQRLLGPFPPGAREVRISVRSASANGDDGAARPLECVGVLRIADAADTAEAYSA